VIDISIPTIRAESDFDYLLKTLEETVGFDDVYIVGESVIAVKTNSRLLDAGRRVIKESEVRFIVNHLYGGENGYGEVTRGNELDTSYEVVGENGVRYRYRINIVAMRGERNATSVRVTMRSIRTNPRTLKDLCVEDDIIKALRPSQGMVLVVGGTGSGKTTLLSAGIREMLEDKESHEVICEYSAPIETTYHTVNKVNSRIYQSEVGRDVATFADGVRNALRSNPDVIVVGEARDRETIESSVIASLTGHLVYTTSHANSPPEAIRRMILAFDSDERNSRQADLVASLRLIIVQKLVRGVDGGRVALRGYIVMNDEVRNRLYATQPDDIVPVLKKVIEDFGKPMLLSAQEALKEGLISEVVYKSIAAGEGVKI